MVLFSRVVEPQRLRLDYLPGLTIHTLRHVLYEE